MPEPHPSPVGNEVPSADGDPAAPAGARREGSPARAAAEKVELERRVAELDDLWRRAVAELDNQRKRTARDLSRIRDQERVQVAARWLPVIDNLERALEHAHHEAVSTVQSGDLEPGTVAHVTCAGYGSDDEVREIVMGRLGRALLRADVAQGDEVSIDVIDGQLMITSLVEASSSRPVA